MADVIFPYGYLETMQDGVQADTPLNGGIGIFPELGEQFFLPVLVKGIHDLVGEADKTINIVDGYTQVGVQQADGAAERSAVSFRYGFTALLAYIMK